MSKSDLLFRDIKPTARAKRALKILNMKDDTALRA
jgi:hypothetical protein